MGCRLKECRKSAAEFFDYNEFYRLQTYGRNTLSVVLSLSRPSSMSLLNHYIYSRDGAIKNNLNGRQAKRKIQRNKQQQHNNSDVIKSYFPFPCFIEPRRRMSTTKRGKSIRKVHTERRNEQKTCVCRCLCMCMCMWVGE